LIILTPPTSRKIEPERVWRPLLQFELLARVLQDLLLLQRPGPGVFSASSMIQVSNPMVRILIQSLQITEHTDELPGNRLQTEKKLGTLDVHGNNVWEYFGKTFEFYYEVFGRNSIDDLGMSMVGSIHFDDELVSDRYFLD
jgi:hypothetical protein